jgi:HlyD family secretion protein
MTDRHSAEPDHFVNPEVEDIVGREPTWILRWGISVILLTVLIAIGSSWFIRYPDILTAGVEITSNPPPVTLVARSGGILIIVIPNGEMVRMGDVVAYIRSNADPAAILQIEKDLEVIDTVWSSAVPAGTLGDLEPDFAELRYAILELKRFRELKVLEHQAAQLRKQESTYVRLGYNLEQQRTLALRELSLNNIKFRTDSILYTQGASTLLDYNEAKIRGIQQLRLYRMSESSVISNEGQLNQVRKQLAELELRQIEEGERLRTALASAKSNLKARIVRWKETYLIISPCAGRIAHVGVLENESFVDVGRELFAVIPGKASISARAELPVARSGKAGAGQTVNIKIDNYPFEEYGLVKGTITSVSTLPSKSTYSLTITLPQGLQTTSGKELEFRPRMTGAAEIITEDMRLLERFLFHFRRLIHAR